MTLDNQIVERFPAVAALPQRRRALLRTGDDRAQPVRERTGDSVCHPSGASKLLIGFPAHGLNARSPMKKLTDGLRRQEGRKGLISGSEMLRCAVRHQAVFK